jgi:transposase
MEACAKAHYWARELIALGHGVRLMPPAYFKRNKNDAIYEAVTLILIGSLFAQARA